MQLQISNDVPFTYQSHSMPQNMILLRDKVWYIYCMQYTWSSKYERMKYENKDTKTVNFVSFIFYFVVF
jgi:hypothetical protein